MWRIFILTVFLTLTEKTLGAEKSCKQIGFCNKLRHQTLNTSSQFAADLDGIEINSDATIATIPLFNLENKNLSLEITLLADKKIRLKVLEPESEQTQSRYALVDVLDNVPKAVSLNVTRNENSTITLRPKDLTYSVVITSGPPFTVEFYLEGKLETIFSGDRLVMENTNSTQSFTFGVEFEGASRLYGLAHHAFKIALAETGERDPFRLRAVGYGNRNTGSTKGRYGVIPLLYGHSVSHASGIFLHNAAEEWVDISYSGSRPSAYFMVESGVLDLFVFLGPTIKEAIRQYTNLTGLPHLPQLWALGYQQCRATYFTQEEVKEVVAKLDAIDFPVDVIVIARGYTDGNRYFEWNPTNFSDPVEMQQNISASGRVIILIVDNHFKVDDNYPAYVGAKNKYFIKYQNGTDFHGVIWPGESGFIDYLNPEARDYYASWFSFDKFVGSTETIAGYWNDMNEPSTLYDESTELSIPFDTVQYKGVLHRDVHNIYGHLNTKSTHAALMIRDKGKKRPFILTRSYFAGSQRYTAMWTGDNQAEWSLMASSYSECLTLNLAGLVFCGADVGGFDGNPDDELYQRWYQAGIWLPFYRAHSNYQTKRREPYLYSEKIQAVLRNAVKTRYRHIPVWYTLFYEHTRSGDPLIRPLLYDYPEYLEYDDHLLLGSDILSRPVLVSKAKTVNVTFPGNSTNYWYRVDNDSWNVYTGGTAEDVQVDMNSAPYFYRGGSIIARRDIERPATSHMVDDPYTLYVNVDSNNKAEGRLYQDDYTSFEYVNNQSYLYIKITYVPESKGVLIRQIDGNSEGFNVRVQKIVIHSKSDDGLSNSATYTTTAAGTPLGTIDIVKELNLKRGPFIIHL